MGTLVLRRFRAVRWALAVAFLATSACSSRGTWDTGRTFPPEMPSEVDPCASYCLVWVPPVYRDVPRVVSCCQGSVQCETVHKTKVEFHEVCTCGHCEERVVPDRCRKTEVVTVTTPKDVWRPVNCGGSACVRAGGGSCGACGCSACAAAPPVNDQCFQRVTLPGDVCVCEKCETEAGFTYCAVHPPKYDVVSSRRCVEETSPRYVPPDYRVVWQKECFQAGHYAWQKRYDCGPPTLPPLRSTCEPPLRNRGDFRSCPSAD